MDHFVISTSVQKTLRSVPFDGVYWGLFNMFAINIALEYFPKECSRKLRMKGPYIAFKISIVSHTDVYT